MTNEEARALGFYTAKSEEIKKLVEARDKKLKLVTYHASLRKSSASELDISTVAFDKIARLLDEAMNIDSQIRILVNDANEHAEKCRKPKFMFV